MTVRAHHRYTFRRHYNVPLGREVILAGALGGLMGGVAMALVATIYDAIVGYGFWTPVRAIDATVVGQDAMIKMGAGAIVLGLAIHLTLSMLFGIIFAAIAPRDMPRAAAIAFGMFAGLTILVVMSLVVLPLVNPTTRARLMWGSYPRSLPVLVAFLMHMIFGLGLAMVPWLRRLIVGPPPVAQSSERSVA